MIQTEASRSGDTADPDQRLAERVVARMLEHDAFSRWLGIELVALSAGRCVLRMTVRLTGDSRLSMTCEGSGGSVACGESSVAFCFLFLQMKK